MILCPQCRAIRPEHTTVPDWQCASCGVAYVKAGESGIKPPQRATHTPQSIATGTGFPWIRFGLFLAFLWAGWTYSQLRASDSAIKQHSAEASTEPLSAVAARVKPGDVIMYSTSTCVYCIQAKNWMTQNNIPFSECDIEFRQRCADEFRENGGGGTPLFMVRGNKMSGFSAAHLQQLLAAN
jgi:glutaredoxin